MNFYIEGTKALVLKNKKYVMFYNLLGPFLNMFVTLILYTQHSKAGPYIYWLLLCASVYIFTLIMILGPLHGSILPTVRPRR